MKVVVSTARGEGSQVAESQVPDSQGAESRGAEEHGPEAQRIAELVRRAQRGGEREFRDLMRAYQGAFYGLARRYCGSHEDADDVLQDAFVKVFQNLAGLSRAEAFFPWARRILINTALDHIRRRRRGQEIEVEVENLDETPHEEGHERPDRRVEQREFFRRLERVLDLFPRLREREKQKAGTMSGGEQQMLAMGRALMADPTLLLLDEPSMGLAPQLVEEIFEIVKELNRKEKVSFLLAEQNTNIALRYADYGYILENGRVVMDGEAPSLAQNEDVKEFYLGFSTAGRKSFRDVKSYRRRKRWL